MGGGYAAHCLRLTGVADDRGCGVQDISDLANSVKAPAAAAAEDKAAQLAPRDADANGATCARSPAPPVATPPQPPQQQHQNLMEIELLIEIMLMPHLRDDAETIFEACVSNGLITAESTALLLERRRMQHIMFRKLAAQMPHQDAAAHALWRQHLASVLSWPKVAAANGATTATRRQAATAGPSGSAATSAAATPTSSPLPARPADGAAPPAAAAPLAAGDEFRMAQSGVAAAAAAGGALWPAAALPAPPSAPEASGMDDDDFNVLLDLAAWLSHTASPSPATQQFTFRLYLHIFSLWPGHQGRVRMIQALAHRSQSFATISSHTDPGQMLLPVQAGSIESRVLICLAEEWPQYAPVALLCLLDLLGKQGNAYGIQCMQKQAQVCTPHPTPAHDHLGPVSSSRPPNAITHQLSGMPATWVRTQHRNAFFPCITSGTLCVHAAARFSNACVVAGRGICRVGFGCMARGD